MKKVIKTDLEWKRLLTPEAFSVMRQHGTERAFSNDSFPKARGIFCCAGCGSKLFTSDSKYDSGSGWPSFYQPIDKDVIKESIDTSWSMRRTEAICSQCDGHLGHIFPDGPQPTGLRYCINGVALDFQEQE
ncbi:MAG: peptide-methionine (R)-S-oxide reductase MsrB [Paracoccaceae bacterium]